MIPAPSMVLFTFVSDPLFSWKRYGSLEPPCVPVRFISTTPPPVSVTGPFISRFASLAALFSAMVPVLLMVPNRIACALFCTV